MTKTVTSKATGENQLSTRAKQYIEKSKGDKPMAPETKAIKKAIVRAVKSRFKPSQLNDQSDMWYELEKVLWKLSIDDLDVLETMISSHRPNVPDGT
jgi:hypothetical protein